MTLHSNVCLSVKRHFRLFDLSGAPNSAKVLINVGLCWKSLSTDKHSSLFIRFVNDKGKFHNTDTSDVSDK
jgi:hypothetical protein